MTAAKFKFDKRPLITHPSDCSCDDAVVVAVDPFAVVHWYCLKNTYTNEQQQQQQHHQNNSHWNQ